MPSNHEEDDRTKKHQLGKMTLEVNGREKINGYDLEHITSKNIHTLGQAALYDDLNYLDALDQYDKISPILPNSTNKTLTISDITPQEQKLLEWEEDALQVIVGYARHVLGIRDFTNIKASTVADKIRHETIRDLDRLKVIDPEYYRKKLESLSQKQRKKFNKILNMWDLPDFIKETNESKTEEIDFLAIVLDRDDSGKYTMDTESFREFLRWHNYSHKNAEPDFIKKIPRLKLSYERRLQELSKDGRLPDACLKNIQQINEVPVFLSDGFGTINAGTAGYYYGGKIVVDPIGSGDVSRTINHELTHACIQGNQLELLEDDEERYSLMNPNGHSVYSPSISHKQFDSRRCLKSAIRAMMEGCCEYIAEMVSSTEQTPHLPYQGEQNMINYVIRLSKGGLGWNDFLEAFSTNDSSEFNSFAEKVIRTTDNKDIWLYCGAAFLYAYEE